MLLFHAAIPLIRTPTQCSNPGKATQAFYGYMNQQNSDKYAAECHSWVCLSVGMHTPNVSRFSKENGCAGIFRSRSFKKCDCWLSSHSLICLLSSFVACSMMFSGRSSKERECFTPRFGPGVDSSPVKPCAAT